MGCVAGVPASREVDVMSAAGFWWIDTFRIIHGDWYAFRIVGTNDHRNGESIHWSVPSVAHGYAFRLREVAQ